ncbi:fatty acid desaturase family protein [Gynuella sunshinyii]|uniref:Fatty acid desaturase n=1 Tax=Gynuella sunshinyii YC6258 TaxID=1445510 RepID=A0A0C5VSG1_9GAMM|nr:fatty acid desaturase [Gynuella sunshinyii]AJQ96238.1 fatty acid desaturase [Gynuella sunshinyii YC6258]
MKTQKLYIYKADILPLTFIFLLFTCQCIVYFKVDSIALLLLSSLLFMPLLTFCVSYNHHHAHVPVSNSKILNSVINRVLCLQVWISHYAWILHHNIGHHANYMNQHPDHHGDIDDSNWTREDGTQMGRMEYTIYLVKTAGHRVTENGKKSVQTYKRYLSFKLQNYVLLILLLLYKPVAASLIFIIPSLVMVVYTFWLTYPHHSGLRTEDPYKASRSITHPLYNFWFCNLGYHAAHHIKPGMHWSALPDFHKSIEDKIPDHLIQRTLFPEPRQILKTEDLEYDL